MMADSRGEYYHEIQACISCLGFLENGEYRKEPDVEDSIKDLLRYLRKEKSDTCAVRRELGRAKIVVSDLIPLLKTYPNESTLFDLVIRLLMNLTQPAIICFREEVPKEKIRLGFYLELENLLREYKLGFADVGLMQVLCQKVSSLLERDWTDRSEDDKMLIERVLIVVRNILHISQDTSNEKLLDAEVSLHDQVLWSMRQSGWDTLLLFLSNSDAEQSAFAFHTLEIMSLLFREQDPSVLAKAGEAEKDPRNDPQRQSLERTLEREAALKRRKAMELSFRHNRFGGCYELRGVSALNEQRSVLYHHNPLEGDLSFDRDKLQKRKPKNRAPLRERDFTRRSSLSVQLFLRELGSRFLRHCYNPLLRTAMSGLMREAAQENDETYFMWAMRFFMCFCRLTRPKDTHLISETLNVATFHWLFNQITKYLDQLKAEKKKGQQWSRRLQLAVGAYREMLECLATVDRSADEELRRTAHTLKSNVFYMPEYREIFPHLLKNFDQKIQNRSYLCDLVEGAHLLIKMLDGHVTASGGALVVQGKHRKKGQRKASKPPSAAPWTPERLEATWGELVDSISAAVRGELDLPDASQLPQLFDPAEGNTGAMHKAFIVIQDQLRENRPLVALALFRLAKSLWPEQEALASEDELLALRDIHMTPLERPEVTAQDEEEEETPASSVPAEPSMTLAAECQFDMRSYLLQFAHPHVVSAYVILLEEYDRNTDRSNACVLRMLHRLAVRLELPALLFQLRLFRVFNRLLNEDPVGQAKDKKDPYAELRKFAAFILRRFFGLLEQNEKLVVELLFYKSIPEAQQIAANDYHFQEKKTPQWSEAQDEMLRQLFARLRDEDPGPGRSVADLLCARLGDASLTRRMVVNRLRRLGLIESAKELKSGRRQREETEQRAAHEWTEEQVKEVRQKVAAIDAHQPKPLNVLFGQLSFLVNFRELKAFLVRSGIAPPSWRLRRSFRKKSGPALGAEEEQDPRLLVDTSSSSSSSSDEEEDVGLQSVIGELMSADKGFLLWLYEELSGMLAEEEVSPEGLVLVPIQAEHAAAVTEPPARRILQACGLTPPDDSARYWRLGARHFAPRGRAILADRLAFLKRAAEGEDLTAAPNLNTSRRSRVTSGGSDSSDLSSLDEEFLKKMREGVTRNADESGESEEEGARRPKQQKRRTRADRDGVPRTAAREEEGESREESRTKAAPKKKKMIRITDITFSSEEEEEEEGDLLEKKLAALASPPQKGPKKTAGRLNKSRLSAGGDSSDGDGSPVDVGVDLDADSDDSGVVRKERRSRRRVLSDESEEEEKEGGEEQEEEKEKEEDEKDAEKEGEKGEEKGDEEKEEKEGEGEEEHEDPSLRSPGVSKLLLSDSDEDVGGSQPAAKKRRLVFSDMSDSD